MIGKKEYMGGSQDDGSGPLGDLNVRFYSLKVKVCDSDPKDKSAEGRSQETRESGHSDGMPPPLDDLS